MPNQECTSIDTSELVAQARAAYDEKRTRECLALTKTLLEADPDDPEAVALQSALRADIQRDLDDARALLRESDSKQDPKKYRKAAEIIVLKTLSLDPENEEANALLREARAVSVRPEAVTAEQAQEVPFTAAASSFGHTEKKKKRSLKLPIAFAAVAVIAGSFFLVRQSRPVNSTALAAPAARTEQVRSFQPAPAPPVAEVVTPPALPPAATAEPKSAAPAPIPVAAAAETPAGKPGPIPTVVPPSVIKAAIETGRLAVSSPTAAEIYMGDKYMGSTPTTLQLPIGRQTLEYRHGGLRTAVTHEIKANETTTASIAFQVTLQINAKPWAQVFLDGPARQALGQTPLSGITVPVGTVLIFENPNFASKSHRVTEKDTAIQLNFP
jgi:hypothetical protein